MVIMENKGQSEEEKFKLVNYEYNSSVSKYFNRLNLNF